jgi:hypothetical protein
MANSSLSPDMLNDCVIEFVQRDPFFDWRPGDVVTLSPFTFDQRAYITTVTLPHASADVYVTLQETPQRSSHRRYVVALGVRHMFRVGPFGDMTTADTPVENLGLALNQAEADSRSTSGVIAVWPIGRDIYHPVALAWQGHVYIDRECR